MAEEAVAAFGDGRRLGDPYVVIVESEEGVIVILVGVVVVFFVVRIGSGARTRRGE